MKTYYVLTLMIDGGGSWTFSTREAAAQHVYTTGLCDECKQNVADGLIVETNMITGEPESIAIQDALDTTCGARYFIREITEDEYRERAEAALREIAEMWEREYTDDATTPNEGAD